MKDWEMVGNNWGTVVPEQDDFGPKMGAAIRRKLLIPSNRVWDCLLAKPF
jgi:hypothetical protein